MHQLITHFTSISRKHGHLLFVLVILVTFTQHSNITLSQNSLTLEIKDPSPVEVTEKNNVPQRIFQAWKWAFPCFLGDEDLVNSEDAGEKLRGFIYIKVPKTGSSTLAGINLRIAVENTPNKIAHKTNAGEGFYRIRCAETHRHTPAARLAVSRRDKKYTFLWTFIRDPTSQFLSQFFHFRVSRTGRSPTVASLKEYVDKQYTNKFYPQMDHISTKKIKLGKGGMTIEGDVTQMVQDILDEYDFIGVTERFDESLVVLRLLLGLNAADILYIPAKVGGEYDDGLYKHKCVKITPRFTTHSMNNYLSSEEWHKRNEVAFLLHKAANKSLDLTIQNIGQANFDKAFSEHQYLMSAVKARCASKVVFPCSNNGERQHDKSQYNCYVNDSGCGYPCINEVYADEVKAGKTQNITKSVYDSFEGGESPSKREGFKALKLNRKDKRRKNNNI